MVVRKRAAVGLDGRGFDLVQALHVRLAGAGVGARRHAASRLGQSLARGQARGGGEVDPGLVRVDLIGRVEDVVRSGDRHLHADVVEGDRRDVGQA